jgi:hypothetical protein
MNSFGFAKKNYYEIYRALFEFHTRGSTLALKQKILQIHELTDRNFDKFVEIFSIKGTILECQKKLEVFILNGEALDIIFSELVRILNLAK